MKNFFLIITGPTAVGKTDFTLHFANRVPSEIINIDVGQFYTPLNIGTAKPDWKNQKIIHHLFDIIDEPKNFTVFEYRDLVFKKIKEIQSKNKLPILVGGSGFYIQSLLFPQILNKKSINSEFDNKNYWQELYKIDPKRAEQIDKKDIYRIKRALEIWQQTGKKPSEFVPSYDPPGNYIFVTLVRNRDDLYNRINDRVNEMIKFDWINEVEQLNKEWKSFLLKKKIIGYDDIINFLDSQENSIDVLTSKIQQKTRNYAKRQITFFKMLTKKIINSELDSKKNNAKKIIWINLTLTDVDLYINQLLNDINLNL